MPKKQLSSLEKRKVAVVYCWNPPASLAAFSARAWRSSALGGSSLRCCCADRGTSGMSGSFSRHSEPSCSISTRVILQNDRAHGSIYGWTYNWYLWHTSHTHIPSECFPPFLCVISWSIILLCNCGAILWKMSCAVKVWLTCSAELSRQVSLLIT